MRNGISRGDLCKEVRTSIGKLQRLRREIVKKAVLLDTQRRSDFFFLARRDANNTNLSLQPSLRVRIISNINFPLRNFPAGIFALGTATLNNRSVVLRPTDSAKVTAASMALYILRSSSVYCVINLYLTLSFSRKNRDLSMNLFILYSIFI